MTKKKKHEEDDDLENFEELEDNSNFEEEVAEDESEFSNDGSGESLISDDSDDIDIIIDK